MSVPNTKAEVIGRRVLAALTRGRQLAIQHAQARSRLRAAAIILLYNEDTAKGKPPWGRPGRIARRLTDRISVSQVRKILRRLSCVRDYSSYGVSMNTAWRP